MTIDKTIKELVVMAEKLKIERQRKASIKKACCCMV